MNRPKTIAILGADLVHRNRWKTEWKTGENAHK